MKVNILSPHRDDAAFSCCYFMRAALLSGLDVSLVNVFTVSDYAPYWSDETACDRTLSVTDHRRDEDRAFLGLLSTETKKPPIPMHDLCELDFPLRHGIDDPLSANIENTDEHIDLAKKFAVLDTADLVISPLSLGSHPDHCLVRKAVETAIPAGKIGYYEDLPYAIYKDTEEDRAYGKPENFITCDFKHEDGTNFKAVCASCYMSQIGMDVPDKLQGYFDAKGQCERFYF